MRNNRNAGGLAGVLCLPLFFAAAGAFPLAAQAVLSVTPSAPSANVGAPVTWTAAIGNPDGDPYWYRFRVAPFGSNPSVVKDFGTDNTLVWTAGEHEGLYEIEATAKNQRTGAVAQGVNFLYFQANTTGGQPAILPTPHPLVFLYSAPPCPAGSTMTVQFKTAGGSAQSTPAKDCGSNNFSMNFYLAGLLANTRYTVNHIVSDGANTTRGPKLTFTSGALPPSLATANVLGGPAPRGSQDVLLAATLFTNAFATDLAGNIIWYYPGSISFLTRPEAGGYFWGIVEAPGSAGTAQIVREFDLTGMTVLETNAARVSEQLVALGKHGIGSFHHEARTLSNGDIVVLAGEERILTDVQGPGPVDVLGDMIVVLDRNLNVVWTWDAFDRLDPHRMATLGDVCYPGDCPATYLAPTPNDWLHGNSLQETSDGGLLYSARSQDWVIKIDYGNGNGSGDVIWKMGVDGDFTIDSPDPYPWFSHQHDPEFIPGTSTMTVFDDGNVRNSLDSTANSRAQALQVDETNRVVTPILNQDLGNYSFALGSAQRLKNGDYCFDVGYLSDGTSLSVELDGNGNPVYSMHIAAPAYRSFRMQSMYTSPY